ncbi:hypothetical protein FHS85_001429 [Rhodoligotrophos appendicifer]|uniref:hypothetical protein n=1 Tax=Rhodoligotrophos appendicifer TaxID=987056 RepID=UPI0014796650|nr:hypothetical protein [Rhodoligotrophos appendicifer]
MGSLLGAGVAVPATLALTGQFDRHGESAPAPDPITGSDGWLGKDSSAVWTA